jgi:DNA-binding beta-propeller fold protein YncE
LQVSSTVMHARLSAATLSSAGALAIDVAPATGTPTAALNINVVPVRPALVGPSPDSVTLGASTLGVRFNGGYFSNSVTAEFNGTPHAAVADPTDPTRIVDVTLSAADLNPGAGAGLYPIAVRNSAATPPLAATNVALQPAAAAFTVAATVPLPAGAGPAAVGINPATGIAVIANRLLNSVSRLDLATNSLVGAPIAVGTSPTGVAVDYLQNLAYVANNGAATVTSCPPPAGATGTVSVVDLTAASVSATISGFPASPVSVTVNPNTRLGIVAMACTNSAAIIDLNTNRIVSAAVGSTGANPQAAMITSLNWSVVTPGGAGAISVTDLSRRTTATIVASGAARANNSVTITTAATHSIVVGQPIFVDGVTDPSFNGIFTVTATPTPTSFSYAQTAAAATSGGGTATFTAPVLTANLGATIRGVGLNLETMQAYLVDPTSAAGLAFSLLDQSVAAVSTELGSTSAAATPFTNIAVSVNAVTNQISIVDMRQPSRLVTRAVGTAPRAVAVDPGANVAVVANEQSNDVTIVNLGTVRPLHVLDVSPIVTLAGANPVPITVLGSGFTGASTVRLDESPIATTFVSSRVLTATVPAASLGTARRFALDVVDGGARSNVEGFTVIQAIAVGTAPKAVAIDPERNIALVANSGSANVSVVDLTAGNVSATIPLAANANPQGIAVYSRGSRAVVTNRGLGNATILDLTNNTAPFTITTGAEPLGVAIDPNNAQAVVANSASNSVSSFPVDITATTTANTITVGTRPAAVAVDASRDQALVVHLSSANALLLTISTGAPVAGTTYSGILAPVGVVYDPVSDRYIVDSSAGNTTILVDPSSTLTTILRTGINPTSVAYNFNSATLATLNSASQTITVIDYIDRRVRAILPVPINLPAGAVAQLAMEIHPRTNIAVIVDEGNNRVLIVPLPK